MPKKSTTDGFHKNQTDKSRVKTLIVTEFFKAYFPIINASIGKRHNKIYYIDLFSGQGYYDDGSPSTPIVLLDLVNNFKSNDIRQKLQIILNDNIPATYEKLCEAVYGHEVISKLTFKPIINNKNASDIPLDDYISGNVPSFSFVDPFGYIDVSTEQIWTLVKNIGSDCILFFNANRILQDIGKHTQEEHFKKLFGNELQNAKTIQTAEMSQRKKCEGFLRCFAKNLYDTMNSNKYTRYKLFLLPFCIESDERGTTSHYIVLISKSHKAIQEMKKVMIKYSNSTGHDLKFDSKTQFQISFIHREYNLTGAIIANIQEMASKSKKIFNEMLTVDSLTEKLDQYSMFYNFQVFPYLSSEIQIAVEALDKAGVVEIESSANMRKRITLERKFRFSNNLLRVQDVTKV